MFNWQWFQQLPIVGILRGYDAPQVRAAVMAALEGGIRNVEITMNTPKASELITMLNSLAGTRANIGAGTVRSVQDLEIALSSGASFIVTPAVEPEVVLECQRLGIPVFPGATSPTEIASAFELGASLVKVFPSEVLGPSYIRAVLGPFPNWQLMPTGGVTVESLPEYFRAGALAFGVGTPLFNKERILRGEFEAVLQAALDFRGAYRACVESANRPERM